MPFPSKFLSAMRALVKAIKKKKKKGLVSFIKFRGAHGCFTDCQVSFFAEAVTVKDLMPAGGKRTLLRHGWRFDQRRLCPSFPAL